MKNHVHLLVVPQNNYSLAKTMQKLSLRFSNTSIRNIKGQADYGSEDFILL